MSDSNPDDEKVTMMILRSDVDYYRQRCEAAERERDGQIFARQHLERQRDEARQQLAECHRERDRLHNMVDDHCTSIDNHRRKLEAAEREQGRIEKLFHQERAYVGEVATRWRISNEKLTRLNSEYATKLAASEAKAIETERERDSAIGSYKACRAVLAKAGIPCYFGHGGEPATEGFPRDLADCLQTLVDELKLWKPMTAEEADAAYDAAPAEPMSSDEIDRIVARVTDPTYRPTEPEHVRTMAHIRSLEQQLAASEKIYQQERDQRIACGEHVAELEQQLAASEAGAAAMRELLQSIVADSELSDSYSMSPRPDYDLALRDITKKAKPILSHPAGASTLAELQRLRQYKELWEHAIECVDRAFQIDHSKPEPILPDFCLAGDDKFEAVIRLAEEYRLRQAELTRLREFEIAWSCLGGRFLDHYWDSLEPHKEMILLHVSAVMNGAAVQAAMKGATK